MNFSEEESVRALEALDAIYNTLPFNDRMKVFIYMKEILISLYNVDNQELNQLWLKANKCEVCYKYKCKCKA
jgi:hypothetical protein